jgi:hypothetical protein
MKNNQLINIIQFCFNFHIGMDTDWRKQSPDYIMEKWNSYIGKIPENKNIIFDDSINEWIKDWKINKKTWNEMKEIVKFLSLLNNKPILEWSFSEILDLFKQITGLSFEDINSNYQNGLHPIIYKQMVIWLNYKVNKRHYKLIQIL